MSVTRDANGTASDHNSGVSPYDNTGLTIGSHSNLVLLWSVNWNAAPGAVTVTWDQGGTNQTMTLVKTATSSTGYLAQLYGLINPTQGNKRLRVTFTNAVAAVQNGTSYFNVDQTSVAVAFYNTTSATGTTTWNTVVTSATGDMTATSMSANTGTGTTNQTLLYFLAGSGGSQNGGASEAAGAASVTHTWTIDTGVVGIAVGCSIKQVSAGGFQPAWGTKATHMVVGTGVQ